MHSRPPNCVQEPVTDKDRLHSTDGKQKTAGRHRQRGTAKPVIDGQKKAHLIESNQRSQIGSESGPDGHDTEWRS